MDCEGTCDCSSAERCDIANGCVACPNGYENDAANDCSVDIDECASEDLFTCEEPKTCNNLEGSYECICPSEVYNTNTETGACGTLSLIKE